MKVADINGGLCLAAYFYRFIIHDPIINILSVYMVFQIILCKVMQILQGLKQRTFGFLTEGFWPSTGTPPCQVLKGSNSKSIYLTALWTFPKVI